MFMITKGLFSENIWSCEYEQVLKKYYNIIYINTLRKFPEKLKLQSQNDYPDNISE